MDGTCGDRLGNGWSTVPRTNRLRFFNVDNSNLHGARVSLRLEMFYSGRDWYQRCERIPQAKIFPLYRGQLPPTGKPLFPPSIANDAGSNDRVVAVWLWL